MKPTYIAFIAGLVLGIPMGWFGLTIIALMCVAGPRNSEERRQEDEVQKEALKNYYKRTS